MKKSVSFVVSVLFALSAVVQSAAAQDAEAFPVSLKGKKIAILLDNEYQVGEAYYTPLRFREAGAEVKIVSHDVPLAHRFHPTFVHYMKTDMTPKEALGIRWDGVVVIGGFSPLTMREDPDVIKLIRDVDARGGMVSAICHGVCVLVTADLLRGKTVTGNVPRSIEFSNAGANYKEVAPQVDGNLITAIGPQDNGPYLDAMLQWFAGGEKAALEHQYDQYLKGKRVAIVLDDRYEYSQVEYPANRLRHNGATVTFVANKVGEYGEYRNVMGPTKADISAQDAAGQQFDAVIVIGHYAADTFRRHADVRQFVTHQMRKGALVASINWGHTLFIQADIAKGYSFAATWGMQNDIKNAGGKAVPAPVFRDRNLITCASDDDMPHLMRLLVHGLVTGK